MDSQHHLLPPSLIELQIGQIYLLLAMYPEEITLDDSAQILLEIFRDSTTSSNIESAQAAIKSTPNISMLLDLPICAPDADDKEQSPNNGNEKTLRLDLSIPFVYTGEGNSPPDDAPSVKVRIQQPNWLSKASTTQLGASIPQSEDVLGSIEFIREAALAHLSTSSSTTKDPANAEEENSPLVRVWFYFPSISTRSKRDDFIIHAPSYSLTGFLYAGKPGLLCVEGTSKDIDDYMRFINTESWGDIPPGHKKVSERLREVLGQGEGKRVFDGMEEITDKVGERRGVRANRGDMKAVEEWLVERGLGEAFTRVLM